MDELVECSGLGLEQREQMDDSKDQEFEAIFSGFSELVERNELMDEFDSESWRVFKENFKKSFYGLEKAFHEGGNFGGIEFSACQTPAHSFDKHVKRAIICQMVLLPGFLNAKKEESTFYSQKEVEAVLVGEAFHDIGWLINEEDGENYSWAGEKFFDHCEQSVELAPRIAENLGFGFSDKQRNILKTVILQTEFNKLEEEGERVQEEKIEDLAKLTWAADFLSYFSGDQQVPDTILDLYREGFARAKGARVKTWLDEEIEEEIEGQKVEKQRIERVTGNNKAKADELKRKLSHGISKVRDVKFLGAEGDVQTVQDYTTSEFLMNMEGPLEPYLDYSDYFFEERGERNNWLREKYYINIARIRTLQEIAQDFHPVNPLCFLEGALMEDDFIEWFDRLKVLEIAQTDLDSFYEKDIDLRVLGLGPDADKPFFERLVTSEIRETLAGVDSEKRVQAAAELLKIIKEKKRGKGAFKEIWLNLSPYAYIDNQGEKGGLLLTEENWLEALKIANEREEKPDLKLSFCLRRDKWEMEEDSKTAFSERIEGLKRAAEEAGQDLLITIGGIESKGRTLADDEDFIKSLAKEGVKVFVYAGQVFNPEGKEELIKNNINTALDLAKAAKEKTGTIAVGLQGLCYLDETDREEIIKRIISEKLPVMFSYTSDKNIGILEDMSAHPLAFLAGEDKVGLKFLNLAVFMPHEFIPSSAPIEFFRLMRAIEQRREDLEQETIEGKALEMYRMTTTVASHGFGDQEGALPGDFDEEGEELTKKQTREKRKEDLMKAVLAGYLELFRDIKTAGSTFFSSFA